MLAAAPQGLEKCNPFLRRCIRSMAIGSSGRGGSAASQITCNPAAATVIFVLVPEFAAAAPPDRLLPQSCHPSTHFKTMPHHHLPIPKSQCHCCAYAAGVWQAMDRKIVLSCNRGLAAERRLLLRRCQLLMCRHAAAELIGSARRQGDEHRAGGCAAAAGPNAGAVAAALAVDAAAAAGRCCAIVLCWLPSAARPLQAGLGCAHFAGRPFLSSSSLPALILAQIFMYSVFFSPSLNLGKTSRHQTDLRQRRQGGTVSKRCTAHRRHRTHADGGRPWLPAAAK